MRTQLYPQGLLLGAVFVLGAAACSGGSSDSNDVPSASPADPAAGAPGAPRCADANGTACACPTGNCPRGTGAGAAGADRPACGATEAQRCDLGRACKLDADCTSGLCGKLGPNAGTCVDAPSCTGGKGADGKCGSLGDQSCCLSPAVPGGSYVNYDNSGDASHATVSPFRLDAYEITVGRMRSFVTAVGGNVRGNAPPPGAGAHPRIAGSGWRASWNVRLPGGRAEFDARLTSECAMGGNNTDFGAATWTPEPGPNEDKPVNCVDWYTLFAFCVWDGGRLPTDAEWGFVAASGDEQRAYPWGNGKPLFSTHKDVVTTALPDTDGTVRFTWGPEFRSATDGPAQISPVGAKTERSAWGHTDLGGNVIEYTLDLASSRPETCVDCADVDFPDPPQGPSTQPPQWQVDNGDEFSDARAALDGQRLARGGSWQGEQQGHPLRNGKNRHWYPVWRTYSALGGRCARD